MKPDIYPAWIPLDRCCHDRLRFVYGICNVHRIRSQEARSHSPVMRKAEYPEKGKAGQRPTHKPRSLPHENAITVKTPWPWIPISTTSHRAKTQITGTVSLTCYRSAIDFSALAFCKTSKSHGYERRKCAMMATCCHSPGELVTTVRL